LNNWTLRPALVYMRGMRQLHHPALADVSVEGILHALSDPVRAGIFARICASGGSPSCAAFQDCPVRGVLPKSTLSMHFRVLREAGLVRSERSGVELRNTSRRPEIDQRFPGLLDALLEAYAAQRGALAGARRARRRA
jgi:DNA-binding transcriptional ArsR family regulator